MHIRFLLSLRAHKLATTAKPNGVASDSRKLSEQDEYQVLDRYQLPRGQYFSHLAPPSPCTNLEPTGPLHSKVAEIGQDLLSQALGGECQFRWLVGEW